MTSKAPSSVIRNGAFLVLKPSITAVVGYAYWLIAARFFDVGDLGIASAGTSLLTVCSVLAAFGVNSYLVYVLPKAETVDEWSRLVTAAVLLCAGTGTLAGLVAVGLVDIGSHNLSSLTRVPDALCIVVGSAMTTMVAALDGAATAMRSSWQVLARGGAFAVSKLGFLVLVALVVKGSGTLQILGSWVAALFIMNILGAYWMLPGLQRGFRLRLGGMTTLWRDRSTIMGHYVTTMGGQVAPFLLPPLVATILTPRTNAFFYVCWNLALAAFMISPNIGMALYAEARHRQDATPALRLSILLTFGLLLPIIVVLWILAKPILLLFGEPYAVHGVSLLRILALSAIPDSITNLYEIVARYRNRLRESSSLNLAMSLGAIGLALWLLPVLGIDGAGYAWLIAQSCGATYVAAALISKRRRRSVAARALDA